MLKRENMAYLWCIALAFIVGGLVFTKTYLDSAQACLTIGGGCVETNSLTSSSKQMRTFQEWVGSIQGRDFLHPDQRKWFRGTLHTTTGSHTGRFRVKGDLHTHFRGPQASLRVAVFDKTVGAKRVFDYIVPWDKDYAIEPLAQTIAGHLGMASIVGTFKLVSVLGKEPDLYYVVEHPTKVWLEQNGMYAAPIFTFSNHWTVFVDKRRRQFENYDETSYSPMLRNSVLQTSVRNTYPKSYEIQVLDQTSIVQKLFLIIRKERWSTKDVQFLVRYLDQASFEKFFALQCFFGSNHGLGFGNNMRLYYNPKTTKFEVLPWDVALMQLSKTPQCRLDDKGETSSDLNRLVNYSVLRKENIIHFFRKLLAEQSVYRKYLLDMNKEIASIIPDAPHINRKMAEIIAAFDQNMIDLERLVANEEAS